MSALQFFQPATTDQAIALLAASPLPVDSPTQHRIRGDGHLVDAFESGRRRPEWVWAVRRDDDPAVLGVVAAFGAPDGSRVWLLDHFGLPTDPATAHELVAVASRAAWAAGAEEAGIFAPAGSTVDDHALAHLVEPLRDAGWVLLVERRHYEFEPADDLGSDVGTGLRFERMVDPADPRLAACHREVMRDTLDEHDRVLVERVGFDRACRESLAFLLDADPVDCIHLAQDATGEVVGLVSGRSMPTGRAFVLFVGVGREHRGRGYGRQLLAWQTRELVAGGAHTLVADTDNANVPMARAFADVGWPQTETRIDLVPR
ncbi:GNAT family N-acetyltransferase [Nocardioides cynanchi]|uniref:GNAT family N-acetyltransferase n=1 Tax=Nocardioides cynanchi TaxID=2558918 RepID=UPI00124578A9|nr:GNAT family N-acetyltransferase [Nocardioides cynanchi]